MSTVEVNPDAVDAAASTIRSTCEELARVADQVGRALAMVGGAAASTTVAATGQAAARAWSGGLHGYADVGAELARATQRAAQAYDLVEAVARHRFTPAVLP